MKLSISNTIFLFLFGTTCYSQNWLKQDLDKSDSLYAKFSWDAHDNYHSAFGEIILSKSGKFNYVSARPLNNKEFSKGFYKIKKDTLILNSELQPNNIKVSIEYLDSLNTDSAYKILNFPLNELGKPIYQAYYSLNNDTSLNNMFFADFPFTIRDRNLLNSIHSLKVRFNNSDFSSDWIPISFNNKFIKVVIISQYDLNNYKPKVLTDYKFLLKGKRLIDISGSL